MHREIALVGAGPIGLEMAVALKQRGYEYIHYEAGCLASTIAWYAPGTSIFSSPERIAIAGVPFQVEPHNKATREEYLLYLRTVAAQYALEIHNYRRVTRIRREPGGRFRLSVTRSPHGVGGPEELARSAMQESELQEEACTCEKLILSIGDMHLPQMAGIPGEDLPFVSHYLKDPHYYAGTRTTIVGSGNSAAEAAIRLFRAGAHVTLCIRGEEFDGSHIKFWILPELLGLIREGKIRYLNHSRMQSIDEVGVHFETPEGETTIPTDQALLLVGYRQDSTLFEQLGIELEGEGRKPVYDETTMETNVPGVFVIGTGAAGTKVGRTKFFIETSHVHIPRVLARLGTHIEVPEEPYRPVELREM